MQSHTALLATIAGVIIFGALFLTFSSQRRAVLFRLRIRAYFLARAVRKTQFSAETCYEAYVSLYSALYSQCRVVPLPEAANALAYLRLAMDHAVDLCSWVIYVIMGILIVSDSAAVGLAIVNTAGVDIPAQWREWFAYVVGIICGGILGVFAHIAGHHHSRFNRTQQLRQTGLSLNLSLPSGAVSMDQAQSIDSRSHASLRAWVRTNKAENLTVPVLFWFFVIAVGGLMYALRMSELALLRSQNVPGLPSDYSFLFSLTTVLLIFLSLQACVYWIGYNRVHVGHDSARAYAVLHKGSLRTLEQVHFHNRVVLSDAQRLKGVLHQRISKLHRRYGCSPLAPPPDPETVLQDFLAHPSPAFVTGSLIEHWSA